MSVRDDATGDSAGDLITVDRRKGERRAQVAERYGDVSNAGSIPPQGSYYRQLYQTALHPERRHAERRARTVADIPDAELLRRAVRSARVNRHRPKWVAVKDTFALGSTYARQLCRRFHVDPDATSKLSQDLPPPPARPA